MTVLRASMIWCGGLLLALTGPSLAQEVVAPLEGPSSDDGLITIESDSQTADNVTGVVTAIGNVRIVYPLPRNGGHLTTGSVLQSRGTPGAEW